MDKFEIGDIVTTIADNCFCYNDSSEIVKSMGLTEWEEDRKVSPGTVYKIIAKLMHPTKPIVFGNLYGIRGPKGDEYIVAHARLKTICNYTNEEEYDG